MKRESGEQALNLQVGLPSAGASESAAGAASSAVAGAAAAVIGLIISALGSG